MNYMGIDCHKQASRVVLEDEKGKVLKEGWIANLRSEAEEFLRDVGGEVKAVVEAGRSSYVMVEMLKGLVTEVKVAHPAGVKAIAAARIKTDKRDAKVLADLLRGDLIPEVYQRSDGNREAQRVLRQRSSYVGMRTMVKNRVHALLAQQREGVVKGLEGMVDIFTKKGVEVLRGLELGEPDQTHLGGMVDLLEELGEKIKETDGLVEELYEGMEEAKLISTVPGFGKFFSVLAATEIGDPNRFGNDPGRLASYAGLVPSTYGSGDKMYHGRITKQGNKWLRWACVEAVWPAIRGDAGLRLFYERHARSKGPNKAKVATARRLLTIIYVLLREKRRYIPHKLSKNTWSPSPRLNGQKGRV